MNRKRKHLLMTDTEWEAQKAANRERYQLALLNQEYPFAVRARNPRVVVASDPDACTVDCWECHGEVMTVDENGQAQECTRYRNRKDRRTVLAIDYALADGRITPEQAKLARESALWRRDVEQAPE